MAPARQLCRPATACPAQTSRHSIRTRLSLLITLYGNQSISNVKQDRQSAADTPDTPGIASPPTRTDTGIPASPRRVPIAASPTHALSLRGCRHVCRWMDTGICQDLCNLSVRIVAASSRHRRGIDTGTSTMDCDRVTPDRRGIDTGISTMDRHRDRRRIDAHAGISTMKQAPLACIRRPGAV